MSTDCISVFLFKVENISKTFQKLVDLGPIKHTAFSKSYWPYFACVTARSSGLFKKNYFPLLHGLSSPFISQEFDYYTPSGEFRVDAEGSKTLLNCMMYKMCYYRFGQVYTEGGQYHTLHIIVRVVD